MEKGLIIHTIIFNENGEVLIVRRAQTNRVLPNKWDIPGGTLEDGEDPAEGAIRETKEESGLDIKHPHLFYQTSNVDQKKNKQFVTLIFLAKTTETDVVLNPEEHDDYKWINMADAGSYELVDYLPGCLELLKTKSHNLLEF